MAEKVIQIYRQRKPRKRVVPTATRTVPFPLIMFLAAVTKDLILDTIIFATLMTTAFLAQTLAIVSAILMVIPIGRVIGAILRLLGRIGAVGSASLDAIALIATALGIVIGLLYALAFALWFMFKSNSLKRMIWRRVILGAVIATLTGFIPIIGFIIPEYTLLVLYTYRQEKKAMRRLSAKENTKMSRISPNYRVHRMPMEGEASLGQAA